MNYTPEKNQEYLRERYAAQRQMIYDYLGHVCVVCGSDEELEVDHINWREKSFSIGRLWSRKNYSELFTELDKCQILCNTHHRAKSSVDLSEIRIAQSPGPTHGGMYAWMKLKCDCESCSIARREWHDKRNTTRRGKGAFVRGPYKPRARMDSTVQ